MTAPEVVRAAGTPEEVITEEMVREAYGVDCLVLPVDGYPHVVLREALPDRV